VIWRAVKTSTPGSYFVRGSIFYPAKSQLSFRVNPLISTYVCTRVPLRPVTRMHASPRGVCVISHLSKYLGASQEETEVKEKEVINLLTGEPILPARTANQHLARYWFAVRAGKIGSSVRRFINRVPPGIEPGMLSYLNLSRPWPPGVCVGCLFFFTAVRTVVINVFFKD
jgi:hypothetical protein